MAIKNLGNAIKAINPNAEFICDLDILDNIQWINGTQPIAKADIEAKIIELDTADANEKKAKEDLKASARSKLIAGEPLTQEESDTIVI